MERKIYESQKDYIINMHNIDFSKKLIFKKISSLLREN